MDLLEIRKKAKKAKDSKKKALEKDSLKETASEAAGKSGKSRTTDTVVNASDDEIQKNGSINDEVVAADERKDNININEVQGTISNGQDYDGNPDGFLAGVMEDLYQNGYGEEDEEEEEERIELLCFMLSDEEYAVDINDVREIIKMAEITEVPKIPDYMLGIISLRGTIIPLLDLRKRLKLEADELNANARIIIVSVDDNSMGMLVDSVTEVVRLKKGVLDPPPSLLTNVNADLLKGVDRYEDRLLIVPNLSKIFEIDV